MTGDADSPGLVFTGERFLPECRGEIWLEHWHRYHFAALAAAGATVLDVASGEGYGSAILALRAARVVGLDASSEAIAHARSAYGYLHNAAFAVGDCARLPFPDASFDIVVSFETIEHITAQREFLGEAARVLREDGVLLLSSPNKAEYTDRRGYENPYHVAELYRDELAALVDERFPHVAWFGQRIGFASTIVAARPQGARGELVEAAREQATERPDRAPLYYIVGCARSAAALERLALAYSVLGDPDDDVYRDYRDTYRKFVAASETVQTYRTREAEWERDRAAVRASAEADIAFMAERLRAAESQRDAAREDTVELRADAARLAAENDALKTLVSRLGAEARAAQDRARELARAVDDVHGRYAQAVSAAQASLAATTSTLEEERALQREERERFAAAMRERPGFAARVRRALTPRK